MPDSLSSPRTLLASLVKSALRRFLLTALLFTLAGALLAAVAYSLLREQPGPWAFLAFAVAFAEAMFLGVAVGAVRTKSLLLARGVRQLHLGRTLVNLVFDNMLGIGHDKEPSQIARRLERLPLVQAEERLNLVVNRLTGDAEQGGWLRRQVQTRLLHTIHKYTLARFRREGPQHGGVNLLDVKEDLERTIDDRLVGGVRTEARLWTFAAILLFPLLVAAQTWLLFALATR